MTAVQRNLNLAENNPLNICVLMPYIEPIIQLCKQPASEMTTCKATTIAAKELFDRCASETYAFCLETNKNTIYPDQLTIENNDSFRKMSCLLSTSNSCKQQFNDFLNEYGVETFEYSLPLLAGAVCVASTAIFCCYSLYRRRHA